MRSWATSSASGTFAITQVSRSLSLSPEWASPRRCNSMLPKSGLHHRLICWRHREVVEIHVAVGLRPQADASRNRLGQDMLQVKLAVEIGRDLGPGDADLEVVPLAGRGRRIANPFHRGSLAFLEFPQDEIVLQRIGADGEIVAVRLEVE